ncbi:hypothetical protein OG429_39990 [Streptomyces sp. NBC_00190]|uniref:hypothetical protein n=1 Tax=unclassified Streptomyces TaxID=2593676 RepID=UPI002E2D20C8|nr:hypothetical protein [Streptomyces sp. NBC_00190]WSZ37565.1 hypothetical protein OG239_00885 [Streptomyces sp. NBC_00868]
MPQSAREELGLGDHGVGHLVHRHRDGDLGHDLVAGQVEDGGLEDEGAQPFGEQRRLVLVEVPALDDREAGEACQSEEYSRVAASKAPNSTSAVIAARISFARPAVWAGVGMMLVLI